MELSNRFLLTDLYQLTMAYGYWKHGRAEEEAAFYLYFRKNPFKGAFTIAAGLEAVIDFLTGFAVTEEDCNYLASLNGNDGKALFEADFLQYLADLRFTCDLDAVPEGNLVFPHTPLLRIKGPLIQAQILETVLLNLVNFSSLIATKAARMYLAAEGDPILEFGLRRAQGTDGGITASRAAYIGGCTATSNVLAGFRYGIPVRGTHAHSWVMTHASEQEAFEAYAAAMPNNCIFLVDTYDTLEGVKKAVKTSLKLRERGYEMVGIRLDSGDLVQLSIGARKLLDEAGFPEARIVASNDLDEYAMQEIKAAGGKVNLWGVGTRLATAYDQPALGGVYKLSAIRNPTGEWRYAMKFSDQPIKVSNPGLLQTRRFFNENGQAVGDLIWNELEPGKLDQFVALQGESPRLNNSSSQDLLQPIFRQGKRVYVQPDIHEIRSYALQQLKLLPPEYLAFTEAPTYPVGISEQIASLRQKLRKLMMDDG
jgi:nicotinate phosphoribosyltransferase